MATEITADDWLAAVGCVGLTPDELGWLARGDLGDLPRRCREELAALILIGLGFSLEERAWLAGRYGEAWMSSGFGPDRVVGRFVRLERDNDALSRFMGYRDLGDLFMRADWSDELARLVDSLVHDELCRTHDFYDGGGDTVLACREGRD
jgi:hypothetical protein